MKRLNPDALKMGDIVLVDTENPVIEAVQWKLRYGVNSRWTHVGGSLGGYDLIEAAQPFSRIINVQRQYVDRGYAIQVMHPRYVEPEDRYKVAAWWASLNNLSYAYTGVVWFGLAAVFGKGLLWARNKLNLPISIFCSELLTHGLYKEGYNLFDRPAANVLPADYADTSTLDLITNIWLPT